jgi:hypothetical protein
MRPSRPIPPALSAAPFSARIATRSIGRGTLTGPSYRRLTRGAYAVAGTDISHGRMVQAMRTVLPADAVLRGWSAAWALGVRWAAAADPVEVALPHGRRVRRRSGLLVTGEVLHASEVVGTDLGLAASPARTAFDLARRLPDDQAVAAMDALLRACGALADEVVTVAQRHPRSSGRSRALAAARLADPRSE